MERLERLVVHVEEALRLAAQPDEAHQRVALLLLDSAAELLLHRACQAKLQFMRINRQLLELLQAAKERGDELDDDSIKRLHKLESSVPSATKLRRIERNFDAKAEYLQREGELDPAQVRVLAKLHRYRNEAYHQDAVRPGSLSSAVRIYAYLVCTLLRDLKSDGLAISMTEPPGLKAYIDRYGGGFELRGKIAEEFLQRVEITSPSDLSSVLATHLDDRLQGVLEGLEEGAHFLIGDGSQRDQEELLQLLHARDGAPKGPRTRQSLSSVADIQGLRSRSQHLAGEYDPVAAFREFADVEDAFEPTEEELEQLLGTIEREIQSQIDIARGK